MQQFMNVIIDGTRVVTHDTKYGKIAYFKATQADMVPVSENAVFRNPEFHYEQDVQVELPNGDVETKTEMWTIFGVYKVAPMRVSAKVRKMLVSRAEDVLLRGILVELPTGEKFLYRRVMRSASQSRTGKFLVCHADKVLRVRQVATYGWINQFTNKKVKNVAKIEPYAALSLTSSLSAGTGYTSIDIDDYEAWVDVTEAQTIKGITDPEIVSYAEHLKSEEADREGIDWKIKIVNGKERVFAKMELTDGQALCSPSGVAKASFRIGQIVLREYQLITSAFSFGMSFAEQLQDEKLARVWEKVSRGMQFRYGIKKGFFIMVDHDYVDENGVQYDLVFPDGAIKGQVRGENKGNTGTEWEHDNVELCIANVAPTEEKEWGKLNYQFIQALDLDFNNERGKSGVLKKLADQALVRYMKAIESPDHAMTFLGMVASSEEEEDAMNQTFASKLKDMLVAHPDIFYTRWVQRKIKDLVEKQIEDIRLGRIPMQDARFVFIVTDPSTLHGAKKPLLGPGEYYYNGQVGSRAIFRSPLVHKSEVVKIDLVSNPELDKAFGHMHNVLIMNAYDDTLPRMGGASL